MPIFGGQSREEWADDHGYYHWKCRDCGESGWTDTSPDCSCRQAEEAERREAEYEMDRLQEAHEMLESAKKYLSAEWYPDWSVVVPLHILNDAQIAIEKELSSLGKAEQFGGWTCGQPKMT